MRVDHRISLRSSATVKAELATLGIDVEPDGFITFIVPESDPRWCALASWVAQERPVDLVSTSFTKAEIANADWLELIPEWHHGYPQPEDDFGYRHNITYDDSAFCSACGVGLRQVAPFRMKKEPAWGKRSLLQLNWVFDEFFAMPTVQADVLRQFGVGDREVLNSRGEQLRTVTQLDVSTTVAVDTEGLDVEECSKCHVARYVYPKDDASPRLMASPENVHIVRAKPWFGSGAMAYRPIYLSQKLARAFQAAKVRGATFRPATRNASAGA